MSLEDYRRARTEANTSLVSWKRAMVWLGYIEDYRRARTAVGKQFASYKRAKTRVYPIAYYTVFVSPD